MGLLALSAPACAWEPLRDARGLALAWPAAAWPLPLASEALADRAAAAAWSSAGPACFAPTAPAAPAVDGRVSVTAWPAERWAAEIGDPALIAFTLITHEGATLTDADVILNTDRYPLAEPPAPRRFARRTVVAHELGHALGLGHPCGDRGLPACDATEDGPLMAPRLGPSAAPIPGTDDLAGLAAQSRCAAPPVALGPPAPVPGGHQLAVTGPVAWAGTWDPAGRWRPLPLAAPLLAPADALAVEIWSAAGRGAQLDLPPAPPADPPGPVAGGGCAQAVDPQPTGPLWLSLPLCLALGLSRARRAPLEPT